MCGRYTFSHEDQLAKRFDLSSVPKGLRPNYNVAPTQTMPVILEQDGNRKVEAMRWSILRHVGPDKVVEVFNTRDDKAFGSWKRLTMTQRVLVPASGYYEWKKLQDGKQPWYMGLKDSELFAFAGIYDEWHDPESDRKIKVYSIITTTPNKEASAVHNRMPVILHRSDESAWLSSSTDNDRLALEAVLRPYDDDGLKMYEVSRDVNVARTNEERLIRPLNSK